MTLNYVKELRRAIAVRTDRVNHLEKMIDDIHSRYKSMAPEQLNEAVRDIAGMRRELEDHRKFCDKAKREVATFFAPVVA
jgi:ppGpp synthetase/RelA/SpoT-type nucleotidyltranferase